MGVEDYKKEIISMLEEVTDIPSLQLSMGQQRAHTGKNRR